MNDPFGAMPNNRARFSGFAHLVALDYNPWFCSRLQRVWLRNNGADVFYARQANGTNPPAARIIPNHQALLWLRLSIFEEWDALFH